MLNSFIRNAAAAASPVNASGVAATSVCPIAPVLTNAASKSCRYSDSGWCPVASRTIPETKNATTIDPAGTATSSQRGCSSLRSIRTGIPPSRHQQADLLDACLRAAGVTDDRAFVHHRDPVGEPKDLVQILADQQDGHSIGRSITEVRVHSFDRADIETAR